MSERGFHLTSVAALLGTGALLVFVFHLSGVGRPISIVVPVLVCSLVNYVLLKRYQKRKQNGTRDENGSHETGAGPINSGHETGTRRRNGDASK